MSVRAQIEDILRRYLGKRARSYPARPVIASSDYELTVKGITHALVNECACKHCGHNVDTHDEETGHCMVIVKAGHLTYGNCTCVGYAKGETE